MAQNPQVFINRAASAKNSLLEVTDLTSPDRRQLLGKITNNLNSLQGAAKSRVARRSHVVQAQKITGELLRQGILSTKQTKAILDLFHFFNGILVTDLPEPSNKFCENVTADGAESATFESIRTATEIIDKENEATLEFDRLIADLIWMVGSRTDSYEEDLWTNNKRLTIDQYVADAVEFLTSKGCQRLASPEMRGKARALKYLVESYQAISWEQLVTRPGIGSNSIAVTSPGSPRQGFSVSGAASAAGTNSPEPMGPIQTQ